MSDIIKDRSWFKQFTKSIIESINDGIHNDNIYNTIESLNVSEANHVLDILKNQLKLNKITQGNSIAVLFSYWLLFIQHFGRESIKYNSWDSFLLIPVSSQNLKVNEKHILLLKEIVKSDKEFALKLFEVYFKSITRIPLVEKVLAYFSTQNPKLFYNSLAVKLKNSHNILQCLRLLTQVTTLQSLHVDIIVETSCMKVLLDILKSTTNLSILGLGLLNLTILIPLIPHHIPVLLPSFFLIVKNIIYIKSLPRSIKNQFEWFLLHIYGMYPLSFIKLVKEYQSVDNINEKLQPFLTQLPFNMGLLSTIDNELDPNRWMNKESHQIVIDCLKNDYDKYQEQYNNIDITIETLYNQINDNNINKSIQLGALSSEGQKILQLQDLIEEKILLYPHNENNNENIFSRDQLESRFILLRNELIFERYLQQQYLYRLRKYQSISINTENKEIPSIKIDDQEQIKILKEKNIRLVKKLTSLETKYSNWENDIIKHSKELYEKYNSLLEQYKEKSTSLEHIEEQLLLLQQKYDTKVSQVFTLELELNQLHKERNEYIKPLKKYSSTLKKDLPLWEQNFNDVSENIETVSKLNELLEEKEQTICLLQSKIDGFTQKIIVLSDQMEKNKQHLNNLIEKKQQKNDAISQLQLILTKHKEISNSRISVVEKKYQTIRNINIALEKRCGQLCEQIEKLQQTNNMSK